MATMSVDDQSVRFPTKADKGYGIDTSGRANFSPEGEYANGGAGRGWEWRYLPFTLSEPSDVTITLSASVSDAVHQWVSMTSLSLLCMPQTENGIQEIKNEEIKMKNEEDEMVNGKWSNGKCFDFSGRPATKASGIQVSKGRKVVVK